MNLDDLVLLHGWIKHIEWSELDSQLPEAGQSSRKRINVSSEVSITVQFHNQTALVDACYSPR